MGESSTPDPLEARLAACLARLRAEQGLSLEELAGRTGISRATLSRLERAEASPTAAMLGRLCTAYGRTLSWMMGEVEAQAPAVVRDAAQPRWTDPESGFRRRVVSPPGPGLRGELLEGRLPPGASVAYAASPLAGLEHHLWLLEGVLEMAVEGGEHRLLPGDCLRYRLHGPSRFHCPAGGAGARYVLAVIQP
ncbi:helix-turn-helix domain-containing protein [Pseudoroseomonas cervicalis]|uniref:DNA-binding helix-turn-helix protein n=1 Tax=Pseudoroseomonas cervicalis ATCC 49957 TaxID=525371 RepID=D5RL84_9PROT|nr:XRE family transcriptional regulator [Pseudoroseomonas cervicalis]EFH11934.1 DNA-binding helix-turn-helix protein [Pseudoroseomonas cervicalis ATCC 49957]